MTEEKWETKSLKWIHEVREKMLEEIEKKGMTPVEWLRSRKEIDLESLCKRLGLNNYTIAKKKSKT